MKKEIIISEGKIIDGHTHASGIDVFNYFVPRLPSTQSINELGKKMKDNDISYCLVFPMPFSLYYNPRLASEKGRLQSSGLEDFPYEKENKALLYEVSLSSDCFLPFLAIDPREKVNNQIKFLRHTKNYFGLKLHTAATHSSIEDLNNSPFLEILRQRNIPLMVHSGRQENTLPSKILSFARGHPDIRICIAHLAGFDKEIIEEIKEFKNLFIDTSPFLNCCYLAEKKNLIYLSPNSFEFDYSKPLEVLVSINKILKGHLIWGTDEPWTTITDQKTGRIIIKNSYHKERLFLEELDKNGFQDIKYEISNQNIRRFLWGSFN